ncbi:MAG: SLC13 family permease [Turneriella sp.]
MQGVPYSAPYFVEDFIIIAGLVFFLAGLLRGWLDTDVLFLTVLTLFLATGVTDVKTATQGFAKKGLPIIADPFLIVGSVEKSRILDDWTLRFFCKEEGKRISLLKIILPTFSASIFLNNTTLVALLTPIVSNWASRSVFSPAKFLMPMAFAATIGELGSIVGTSTNLVVLRYTQARNLPSFGFFEIRSIGIALFLLGSLTLFSEAFLGFRTDLIPVQHS